MLKSWRCLSLTGPPPPSSLSAPIWSVSNSTSASTSTVAPPGSVVSSCVTLIGSPRGSQGHRHIVIPLCIGVVVPVYDLCYTQNSPPQTGAQTKSTLLALDEATANRLLTSAQFTTFQNAFT